MDLALTGMDSARAWRRESINGIMVRFPNGYGASIINHAGSYGVELAVIAFADESDDSWRIVYDTPITDDVIGWLDRGEATEILRRIDALPTYRKRVSNAG